MKGDASLGWTAGAGEEAEPGESLECMLKMCISGPACSSVDIKQFLTETQIVHTQVHFK